MSDDTTTDWAEFKSRPADERDRLARAAAAMASERGRE